MNSLLNFALPGWLLVATALATPTCTAASDSGPVRLSVQVGHAIRFTLTNVSGGEYQAITPLRLQLLTKEGSTCWLSNTYSSVVETRGIVRCVGTIHTPAGSEFEFSDTFQPGSEPGNWLLKRSVAVLATAGRGRRVSHEL